MPNIGDHAPAFELPNQDGEIVRLSDLRGRKVVLFVFPKADTPGCTAQACAFRNEFPTLEAQNAVVLGLSADSPAQLKAWKKRYNLQYDLLSDPSHKTIDAWGAWGASVLGLIKLPVATRSYWLIDEDGVIIDGQVGIGPEESARRAVRALSEGVQAVQA